MGISWPVGVLYGLTDDGETVDSPRPDTLAASFRGVHTDSGASGVTSGGDGGALGGTCKGVPLSHSCDVVEWSTEGVGTI